MSRRGAIIESETEIMVTAAARIVSRRIPKVLCCDPDSIMVPKMLGGKVTRYEEFIVSGTLGGALTLDFLGTFRL